MYKISQNKHFDWFHSNTKLLNINKFDNKYKIFLAYTSAKLKKRFSK